jgi:hypothetical protein
VRSHTNALPGAGAWTQATRVTASHGLPVEKRVNNNTQEQYPSGETKLMTRSRRTLQLVVKSARSDDVYKDIARIAAPDRGDLRTGRVHSFSVGDGVAWLILRGVTTKSSGAILIDSNAKDLLHVKSGHSYLFEVREVGFFRELWWGWGASDPIFRSTSRVAAISLGLGLLSFLLGALSIALAVLGR